MLLYSNLASLHFSNKYWITLNFAEIHIFRIYRSHTLLICIWFPWDISDFTLNRVKRRRECLMNPSTRGVAEINIRDQCTLSKQFTSGVLKYYQREYFMAWRRNGIATCLSVAPFSKRSQNKEPYFAIANGPRRRRRAATFLVWLPPSLCVRCISQRLVGFQSAKREREYELS